MALPSCYCNSISSKDVGTFKVALSQLHDGAAGAALSLIASDSFAPPKSPPFFSLLSLLSDFLRPRARDLLNGGRTGDGTGNAGEKERELGKKACEN